MENIKLETENGIFIWQQQSYAVLDQVVLDQQTYLIFEGDQSLQAGYLVETDQGLDLDLNVDGAIKGRLIQHLFAFSSGSQLLEDSLFHMR